MFGLKRKRDYVTEFWSWFAAAEGGFREAIERQDSTELAANVNELHGHFQKASNKLAFEFGKAPDGVFEFCVSPGGIRANFTQAEAMAEAAPKIPGWRIFAFKRRHLEMPGIAVAGAGINVDAIGFVATPNESLLDVELWFDAPDGAPEEALDHLLFLFLDCALGEYDVAMNLGRVAQHRGVNAQARPFAEFAQVFDDWKARRDGKPA